MFQFKTNLYKYPLESYATTAVSETESITIDSKIETDFQEPSLEPPIAIQLTVEEAEQLLLAQSHSSSELNQYIDLLGFSYYKEDTVVALKLLQTLPIPLVKELEENLKITYYPHLPAIYVSCEIDNNSWYRFEFVLNSDLSKEIKSTISTSDMNLNTNIKIDEHITLLSKVEITDTELAKRYAEFWIDIDGFLVKMIYRNTAKDISADTYHKFFSNLQVSTINKLS